MKVYLLIFLQLATITLAAQERKQFIKPLHFSLTPGLSTNGLHPGGYSNFISLNVTSGIQQQITSWRLQVFQI